jgi:hypothetical protein
VSGRGEGEIHDFYSLYQLKGKRTRWSKVLEGRLILPVGIGHVK